MLYPPHSLSDNVLNEDEFMHLCPYGDDIWFFGNALLNNTKIRVVEKAQQPYLIEGTQKSALWKDNVNNNRNDAQIKALLKAYPQIRKMILGNRIFFVLSSVSVLSGCEDGIATEI